MSADLRTLPAARALPALLVALLAATAPAAQEAERPAARGVAPPLKIHGHAIPTRDRIYEGDRAPLTAIDVASADYRPDLAALGERSGPALVDEPELRARTLALYGVAPENPPPAAATHAARRTPARAAAPPATGDRLAGGIALAGGVALLLLAGGAVLMRRRRGGGDAA